MFRGHLSDQVSFASHLVRLRIDPTCNAEFIDYLLNSCVFWSYARSHALVSLHQANLNATRYAQLAVGCPPPAEQAAIAGYLNDRTTDIADGVAVVKHQLDLISEYRTRLIADVVTGKVDVREVAAGLRDVDEEQE